MTSPSDNQNEEIITAALIVIGDEILSGRTKDKNIGTIADHLTAVGIRLKEVRIVADEENEIIFAINELRNHNTYLFTTGGIGPTHDDITADCVAKAIGVRLDVDPRAVDMMKARRPDMDLNEARLRMARIPDGGELVENAVSGAPGFMIKNVIVMAGVPNIMQSMLEAVTPRLKTGKKMLSSTLEVKKPEGAVAGPLGRVATAFPDVSMGSYPYFKQGNYGTNLVLRSTDEARLSEAEAALRSELQNAGLLTSEQ